VGRSCITGVVDVVESARGFDILERFVQSLRNTLSQAAGYDYKSSVMEDMETKVSRGFPA
jgi:hypothetical protein